MKPNPDSLVHYLDRSVRALSHVRHLHESAIANDLSSEMHLPKGMEERDAALRDLGLQVALLYEAGFGISLLPPERDVEEQAEPIPEIEPEQEVAESEPTGFMTVPVPQEKKPEPDLIPVASAEALDRLVRTFGSRVVEEDSADDLLALREAVALLPPPIHGDLISDKEMVATLDQTIAWGSGRWPSLLKQHQRMIIGYCAALLHYLQDLNTAEMREAQKDQIPSLFRTITTYSKQYTPGYVNGLMRGHRPEHGSWMDDAKNWWKSICRDAGYIPPAPEPPKPVVTPEMKRKEALDILQDNVEEATPDAIVEMVDVAISVGVAPSDQRLVSLLTDRQPDLIHAKLPKTLKEALKRAGTEDEPVSLSPVPDETTWTLQNRTQGLTAVMVGGTPREDARARIQRDFGFSELEWISASSIRGNQSLLERVRNGSIGAAIVLLRFCHHEQHYSLADMCREVGRPCAIVERGYGTSQIRIAFEHAFRTLDGR